VQNDRKVSEKRNYRIDLVRVIRSVLYLRFFGDLHSFAEVSLRFLLEQELRPFALHVMPVLCDETFRSYLE